MAEKQPETSSIRAAVKAKIDAWTAVLASLDVALALEGVALPSVGGTGGAPMALPVGFFRDKGVKEAIPIYLDTNRPPVYTPRQHFRKFITRTDTHGALRPSAYGRPHYE